ncbi:MAG: hypothetical protein KDE59_27765 [Anaerolineales bacterium]|nr:hypothetical protein [Anaerolineales bacterium]
MVQTERPVLMSGENPGLTLYAPGTDEAVAIVSYWYCTDSPFGVGHSLVLWLADGAVPAGPWGAGGILTDNQPLAAALVNRLTRHFPEFSAVPVAGLPYIEARCQHTYDGAIYRATGQAADRAVTVEWQTPLERKRIVWPAFPAGEAAYDLSTVICPCQAGQIWLDGAALAGAVRVGQAADGTPSSSAFLAFAESWVGPVEG